MNLFCFYVRIFHTNERILLILGNKRQSMCCHTWLERPVFFKCDCLVMVLRVNGISTGARWTTNRWKNKMAMPMSIKWSHLYKYKSEISHFNGLLMHNQWVSLIICSSIYLGCPAIFATPSSPPIISTVSGFEWMRNNPPKMFTHTHKKTYRSI